MSVYLAREEDGVGGLPAPFLDMSADTVLDAGIDNFGFEHVKL